MVDSFPKRIVLKHPVRQMIDPSSSPGQSRGLPLVYRGIIGLSALLFFLASITGIWRIALTRGFVLPAIPEWWPPHGHLMVGGFLAGVILFERIIALQISWLAWVPYVYVISAIFLHTGSNIVRGIHVVALAGWVLHRWLAYQAFGKYEKPLVESVAFMTLSSALIYPGGLMASPTVALAALSFPIATILVERLEMSLNFRKFGARLTLWALILWSALWGLNSWLNVLQLPWMGIATLFLAIGCIRFDMTLWTKRAVHQLHSFLRRTLMVGYVWFLLFAISMIGSSHLSGAVTKDVMFHLAGLGFIFTMILAHAPLILPAAIGKLPPSSAPVIPFVIFQICTVIRLVADILVEKSVSLWVWSGWITGVLHLATLMIYMALVIRSLESATKQAPELRNISF